MSLGGVFPAKAQKISGLFDTSLQISSSKDTHPAGLADPCPLQLRLQLRPFPHSAVLTYDFLALLVRGDGKAVSALPPEDTSAFVQTLQHVDRALVDGVLTQGSFAI